MHLVGVRAEMLGQCGSNLVHHGQHPLFQESDVLTARRVHAGEHRPLKAGTWVILDATAARLTCENWLGLGEGHQLPDPAKGVPAPLPRNKN